MRFANLQLLYDHMPELATSGPSDESLRRILEQAECVVEQDLRSLGYDISASDPEELNKASRAQIERLVAFRALAELLASPSSIHRPELAQYYEQKYRLELRDVALKPSRLRGVPRVARPELPVVLRREESGLIRRVRRWLLP